MESLLLLLSGFAVLCVVTIPADRRRGPVAWERLIIGFALATALPFALLFLSEYILPLPAAPSGSATADATTAHASAVQDHEAAAMGLVGGYWAVSVVLAGLYWAWCRHRARWTSLAVIGLGVLLAFLAGAIVDLSVHMAGWHP